MIDAVSVTDEDVSGVKVDVTDTVSELDIETLSVRVSVMTGVIEKVKLTERELDAEMVGVSENDTDCETDRDISVEKVKVDERERDTVAVRSSVTLILRDAVAVAVAVTDPDLEKDAVNSEVSDTLGELLCDFVPEVEDSTERDAELDND